MKENASVCLLQQFRVREIFVIMRDNDITIFIFRFSFQTKIISVINFITHANLSTCETEGVLIISGSFNVWSRYFPDEK